MSFKAIPCGRLNLPGLTERFPFNYGNIISIELFASECYDKDWDFI